MYIFIYFFDFGITYDPEMFFRFCEIHPQMFYMFFATVAKKTKTYGVHVHGSNWNSSDRSRDCRRLISVCVSLTEGEMSVDVITEAME